jgi:hypothetical protein
MTINRPAWKDLKRELETGVGHYMAAVAERLLKDGLQVSSIYAYTAFDDDVIGGDDVEGSVHFNKAFQQSVKGGTESFLHWFGTSGWCYRTIQDTTSSNAPSDSTRWFRSCLLPTPDRVAAFVSDIRVAPSAAGSDIRPSYRTSCDQLTQLAAHLRRYAPGPHHSPLAHINYEYRLSEAQGSASRDRIIKALLSGDDRVLFMPILKSELHALQHLLDYTEVIAPLTGPGDLAHGLAQDLTQRTSGDHLSVYRHHHARAMAAVQQGSASGKANG